MTDCPGAVVEEFLDPVLRVAMPRAGGCAQFLTRHFPLQGRRGIIPAPLQIHALKVSGVFFD